VPIVALTVPVLMPIGPIRRSLSAALPDWRWRCGDEDDGDAKNCVGFERPHTIMGQSLDGLVMLSIEASDRPLPLEAGAPPHQLFLRLSQPSTENAELAKAMAVVVCASLMIDQDNAAHCQIAPNGRWYSAEDMRAALALCTAERPNAERIDLSLMSRGIASASAPDAGAAPPTLYAEERPRPDPVPEPSPEPFPRRAAAGGFGRKGL
jgi:hypothetical protein